MGQVNRSVVVIKAKGAFLEWTNSLPDPLVGHTLTPLHDDCHVYLFPEWDTHAQREEFLFEQELWSWHRDERMFPRNRTLAMFREWFDVEFHSVVMDLVEGPILEEED